jgi:hypothetical protein
MAEFTIGDRVTHCDNSKPASSEATLPMAGEVVGVQVRYLVQWDGEGPRPLSGWTPTYYYPAAVLRPLPQGESPATGEDAP